MNAFLGIPLPYWSLICLGVAGLYAVVWPKPRTGAPVRSPAVHFILRWFHSLVWVLLAGACQLWAAGQQAWAPRLASMALAVYLVFMLTMVLERGKK